MIINFVSKNIMTSLLLTILFYLPVFSEFNVIDKIKHKVNNRGEQETDNAIDKAINSVVGEIKKPSKNNKGTKNKSTSETEKSSTGSEKNSSSQTKHKNLPIENTELKSYSKFDFIPGDKILFWEDFLQDSVGDFPQYWYTNASGEVVNIEDLPGHWLMTKANASYFYRLEEPLPENFTLEFDYLRTNCEVNGNQMCFYLFAVDKSKNPFEQNNFPGFKFEIIHADEAVVENWGIETYEKIQNSRQTLEVLRENCNKPVKISICAQKQRVRIYVNEVKAFDIPRLLPKKREINIFRFDRRWSDNGFISNVRIAAGLPDMRNKLLLEGKLVTHGILFDVNSDKIKPESFGTLKEIASVLKDNPTIRIKIIGHTDGDGSVDANLELSRMRALSIKKCLQTEFEIEGAQLDTDGKGESEPVGDNTTQSGKASNRRVEFIRL